MKIYELAAVRHSLLEMAEIANDSPTAVINYALPALSWPETASGLKHQKEKSMEHFVGLDVSVRG